ncbi:DUF2509 family protein [Candidatus Pantoea deserta]|uniref:DUF2509 family protein n=1 Tax=Candidatus Pantoea deserta TaxID=1869313 RepID=A0A3N4PG37_9GAMM|nr:DUF2509 family protein [Pantoea deserta]RPE03457.1 DUF2509 family protein [Pantoea deserta]
MNERGNSALGVVLVVLLTGSLTLHASRERLAQSLSLVADERHHIRDFWAAQSALQWGLALSWPEALTPRCQQEPQQGWRSCLQRVNDERLLLSGRAAQSDLALWRWVAIRGRRLEPLPHGWIDYCPLAQANRCR